VSSSEPCLMGRGREIQVGNAYARMGNEWPVSHDVSGRDHLVIAEIDTVADELFLKRGRLDDVDCVNAQIIILRVLCLHMQGHARRR
jgi:hypothetical protein